MHIATQQVTGLSGLSISSTYFPVNLVGIQDPSIFLYDILSVTTLVPRNIPLKRWASPSPTHHDAFQWNYAGRGCGSGRVKKAGSTV